MIVSVAKQGYEDQLEKVAGHMRVLCTGGAGYVGSACVRWLLGHGHDAVAYDNLSEGNREAVPEDRLIVGDIEDREQLAGALRSHRAEAVMHFAAVASVPESVREPDTFWRVNVLGTKTVLDAMLDAGVDRLVFSSTAATYSFDAPMPLVEESEQKPQVPYGTTKLACEWMIREYTRAFGIGHAVLRYFNASGADRDGEFGESRRSESHLIPLVLYAALGQRERISIYSGDWDTSDGTCVRDYVHTDDLASAHQLVLEHLQPGHGRDYNVGTGRGTTVMEVLKSCEDVVGSPIEHEIVGRRVGDPAVLTACPNRLMNELGWQPRFTEIRDIVDTAWRWHHQYPQGYRSKTEKLAAR